MRCNWCVAAKINYMYYHVLRQGFCQILNFSINTGNQFLEFEPVICRAIIKA